MCPSPYVCRLGRCRSECTSQRDCPPGVVCVRDEAGAGSCLFSDERCSTNAECSASLMCIERVCANVCTTAADCPDDSRCETAPDGRARCVRDDVPTDGGTDAAVDAAVDAPSLDVPGAPDDAPDDAPDGGLCVGPGCVPITSLAVGERATCAVDATGRAWCWGVVRGAGLPDVTTPCIGDLPCAMQPTLLERELSPTSRAPMDGVTDLSGNRDTFCASRSSDLWCWGLGGPLGGPGAGDLPRRVRGMPDDAPGGDVTVGAEAAILDVGSALLGWGDARFGELGSGTSGSVEPAPLGLLDGLDATVELGAWHGCAISLGRVQCWGENDFGQVQPTGTGEGAFVPDPVVVAGLPADAVVEIEPARSSSCALTAAGQIWCWGRIELLPRPDDHTDCVVIPGSSYACPPRRIRGGPWAHLASFPFSESHCAIDGDGALYCWGYGDLFPRDPLGQQDPQRVEGLPPITSASIGVYHACAIADGDVWCWGENDLGELGRGTWSDTPDETPMRVTW